MKLFALTKTVFDKLNEKLIKISRFISLFTPKSQRAVASQSRSACHLNFPKSLKELLCLHFIDRYIYEVSFLYCENLIFGNRKMPKYRKMHSLCV